MRINVAQLVDPSAPGRAARRPLVDARKLLEPARPTAPNLRHGRALAVADAAMIMSVGQSARAIRRCAMTVSVALDQLDADSSVESSLREDAAGIILARCSECRRCAPVI